MLPSQSCQPPISNLPRFRPRRGLVAASLGLLLGAGLLVPGCGSGGDGGVGPGTQPLSPLIFGRHRDAAARIAPILSPSGSGFDAREVDSPSVVSDGGRPNGDRFMLYYEATDAGLANSIGLTTSDEEDLVPVALPRQKVVDPAATPVTQDDGGATDPCALVDKSVPFGTLGRYRMWYEGRGTNGTSAIIYAVSGDGVTWTNFTVCTGLVASFADVRIADPCVVLDAGTFKMWFEAVDSQVSGGVDGPASIGYATSTDGVSWTVRDAAGNQGLQAGPVFGPDPAGTFDAYSVNAPAVVADAQAFPGASWLLFYEAADFSGNAENTIGLATSADGLSWTRFAVPVLQPSSDVLVPLPFDSGDLEHPFVVINDKLTPFDPGYFLLYYAGDSENSATPNQIGLAKGNVR